MLIRINRTPTEGKPTIGEMFIDGKFFCYTLEDEDRGLDSTTMTREEIQAKKVFGETAIPYGEYLVTLTHSPRFKRILPFIHNVVGFVGVRIHRGNREKDTLGCPLVGFGKGNFTVLDSAKAEMNLIAKMRTAKEQIKLTIEK